MRRDGFLLTKALCYKLNKPVGGGIDAEGWIPLTQRSDTWLGIQQVDCCVYMVKSLYLLYWYKRTNIVTHL
jgi:hypothetical protein